MTSPGSWIANKVARVRPGKKTGAAAQPEQPSSAAAAAEVQPQPTSKAAARPAPARNTQERLQATLRRDGEALTPRLLRRLLNDLQEVADAGVSDIEAGRRAEAVAQWYQAAKPEQQHDLWLLLSEQFAPDAAHVLSAQQRYSQAAGTDEAHQAEACLRRALVSPRARLLQRFAVFPQGLHFLVQLRAQWLPLLKTDKRLLALDAELEQLFSTWFDVAFLELRRLSWDSPASLLEKLIQYEAVHDIRSWADLKNRLDSDRRCYGFFHPRMPDEPLIFVEVALVDALSDSITPLLDEQAAPADLAKATTAIFYSISNTQTGLRGVSFGDSLIKHVVQTLMAEFPRLRVFATLSPIPGLRAWLGKHLAEQWALLTERERVELARTLQLEPEWARAAATAGATESAFLLARIQAAADLALPAKSPLRQFITGCAARYLGAALHEGRPVDPVARFHLGNGARVERLNWAADPSHKGIKQSLGLMVNYLYDLKRLDRHRKQLAQGRIPVSSDIEAYLPD